MKDAFRSVQIDASSKLRDGMLVLEKTGLQIALVVDREGKLVGTLTNGDVRRAFLKGAVLDAPVLEHCRRDFLSVAPDAGRAEVIDLMQARQFGQIPIVDAAGKLVGLHLLHDVLGGADRPNWAVIMAGGRGSRLGPLTASLPKPMVPVAGRPILERLVLHLVSHGIKRIFLAIHYLGETIESHFGDGRRFGARIEYLREQTPRGSGGALSLLPEAPSHALLVVNGDLVTQADVGALLDRHTARKATATLAVRPYQHEVPYGCVELSGERVAAFEEKPVVTRLINAGIYALEPLLLARVPREGEFPLPALIAECVARGEAVLAFTIAEDWIDVGLRGELHRARRGPA